MGIHIDISQEDGNRGLGGEEREGGTFGRGGIEGERTYTANDGIVAGEMGFAVFAAENLVGAQVDVVG